MTDGTSYTQHDLPGDTVLYWRPRDDDNLTALTGRWSAPSRRRSPPEAGRHNPTSATCCQSGRRRRSGASSYDVGSTFHGSHRDFHIRTPAISFVEMTGTGVFHWRVRAEFPKSATVDAGPYSATRRSPHDRPAAQSEDGRAAITSLLSWDPRLGVKDYNVQIAKTPDFTNTVEERTDNPSYAPR